jgi:ABC-2 type transport system permease protein
MTTTLRDAIALTERPSRPSPVSTTLTFGWRALLKIKHVPEQLFDVLVSPIIFTLMFTYLFGGALAGSTQAYIQFLLPGILVQTILFVTIYTGYTLNTDISKGVLAGSPDTSEIVWVLIASVVLTAVLGPIAMRIYRTRT